MLSVAVLDDIQQLERLAPEWDALDRTLSPRTPFTSPLWCITWWTHYQRHHLKARDVLRTFVVRDESDKLIAVAPMLITHRPGRGPVSCRELQFFGADPYVTEIRGIVCGGGDEARVLDTLRVLLDREAVDWIQWRGLSRPDAVDGLRATFHPRDKLNLVNHFLRIAGSWDTFKSGLPRNIKESLRKCYNSLSREGHAFRLNVVQEPDEVAPALETFFRLHSTRAKATDTIIHDDVFDDERSRGFLRAVCAKFAAAGQLRIFQLVIADDVVATRLGFSLGDELYLYFSGYDVRWQRFSIMTTTVAEAIKWGIEHGYKIINLSTGTDVSKTRWRPEQTLRWGGYSVSRSPVSRLAFNALTRARKEQTEAPAPSEAKA